MYWVYLSPHPDDAAMSCGGIIHQQVRTGEMVSVWTLFAGDPPAGDLTPFAASLHQRWGVGAAAAMAARRVEDRRAAEILGAELRNFHLPDCIYRRLPDGEPLVTREEELWQPAHPGEARLVEQLAFLLQEKLPDTARLVCPLGIGVHIDHTLARLAAGSLGRRLYFYADYPYAGREGSLSEEWIAPHWLPCRYQLSGADLQAWENAVAAHASQISTFWKDETAMRTALSDYHAQGGGDCLWQADVIN
jgi:LmbE family N-acetylglucosaminyl deacetylase